jgi:hypothetical protein
MEDDPWERIRRERKHKAFKRAAGIGLLTASLVGFFVLLGWADHVANHERMVADYLSLA